jgi:gluconolactonase
MKKNLTFLLLLLLPFTLCAQNVLENSMGKIIRIDPAIDSVIVPGASIEKIAEGLGRTEGPVWSSDGNYLLFSDTPKNTIYKWQNGKSSVFLNPSGRSTGLTFDQAGRLIVCEYENRCISRIDEQGNRIVLIDNYKGKKLNSPHDVVVKSDGAIYFTDPPTGLKGMDTDPAKELPYNGVYRFYNGKTELLDKGLFRPNGLAFSPDEQYMYVGNVDNGHEVWARYEVAKDGSLKNGRIFYDATTNMVRGKPHGLKVDVKGNLYCTGPSGIWIFSPQGKYLGGIQLPELPENCAFGDADGKTLYITAQKSVYRIRTNIEGIRPGMASSPAVIGNKRENSGNKN